MATTTGHERSKTLINFSLPKLWGTQRLLRCGKGDDSDGDGGEGSSSGGDQRIRRRSSNFESDHQNRRLKVESSEKEGIEEFREKIMLDLRNVADKMKESIFKQQVLLGEEEEDKEIEIERDDSPPEATGAATVEVRPWNLRKRRAACKASISLGIDSKNQCKESVMNPSMLGNELGKDRSRLLYTLSKKEIEEDYMMMIGLKPPRRPKKRSRTVQKQIDLLNFASYITEITEDLYNVPDQAEKRKS
ncbi:hypothetical protein ISN44_As01g057950 [Arabidopsis suecica]|uniref:Uncharacterized protein n=1 Tax=Arabidopsis suecica TaxID=45249 RepID=A0A8T2HIB5_ARASU|nr:hypothetical protein ISN44_As01g057950 [Arabidopsis suecica]